MGALYRDLQLPLKPITGTVDKATPLTIHSWCVWKDNNSDPSAMMESQAKRLTVYLQNESWLHLTGQTILTLSSSLYRSYWDLTPVSWASLAAFSASLQTRHCCYKVLGHGVEAPRQCYCYNPYKWEQSLLFFKTIVQVWRIHWWKKVYVWLVKENFKIASMLLCEVTWTPFKTKVIAVYDRDAAAMCRSQIAKFCYVAPKVDQTLPPPKQDGVLPKEILHFFFLCLQLL